MSTTQRTGGKIILETLAAAGIDRAFCVPGESYLAVLDAFHDSNAVDLITCRHEAGAGLMAVADARLTRRPGVCFVSRGPGAANATIAIHVAQQDAVPVLFFVGQVERANLGRGAFQEVDYVKTYSDIAKWVVEVHDVSRLSDFVARGIHEATAGTPGPVVISVPEDMLEDLSGSDVVQASQPTALAPAETNVDRLVALLGRSERPLVLAGGDCEASEARAALLAASEAWSLPVCATNKRQHVFPNDHPNYGGHIGYIVPEDFAALLHQADLVIAVGSRLGDVSTQNFRFPAAPCPAQPLVHIYPDAAAVGRNHKVDLGIVANAGATLAALAARAPVGVERRAQWVKQINERVQAFACYEPEVLDDGIDFGRLASALAGRLQPDAIVTMDSGYYVAWAHNQFRFKPTQELIAAVGGAMGLGVPGAVAASIRYPGRQVICLVGDGGFMMTGYELATAMQAGATPKVFVSNNSSYSVIRAHQERAYPGRVVATGLTNPDFAAMARSFGATGLTISGPDDVESVVEAALSEPGAVVVDVRTSLKKINPYKKIETRASGAR